MKSDFLRYMKKIFKPGFLQRGNFIWYTQRNFFQNGKACFKILLTITENHQMMICYLLICYVCLPKAELNTIKTHANCFSAILGLSFWSSTGFTRKKVDHFPGIYHHSSLPRELFLYFPAVKIRSFGARLSRVIVEPP